MFDLFSYLLGKSNDQQVSSQSAVFSKVVVNNLTQESVYLYLYCDTRGTGDFFLERFSADSNSTMTITNVVPGLCILEYRNFVIQDVMINSQYAQLFGNRNSNSAYATIIDVPEINIEYNNIAT